MRIRLGVAEPWDFRSSDGDNLLFLESVTEGSGKYGEWVIGDCTPFTLEGERISSLLLTSRHRERICSDLRAGRSVPANAYYRRDGEAWQPYGVLEAETDPTVISGFLIVTAQAADCASMSSAN